MTKLFELRFTGTPDRLELAQFCQLLDMRPAGRLDDHEDACFGYRMLRGGSGEQASLDLWRHPGFTGWCVDLCYVGEPPDPGLVTRLQAEVLVAAGRIGLVLSQVWPPNLRLPPTAGVVLDVPAQVALVVRLSGADEDPRPGAVPVAEKRAPVETLRAALQLRRGQWRYVSATPPAP